MYPIETSRLLLRPFAENDLVAFRPLIETELNWWGSVGTLEDSKQRLKEKISSWYSPSSPLGYRAIILKESNMLIGLAGLLAEKSWKPTVDFLNEKFSDKRPSYSNEDLKLGYGLGSQYRGRGYVTEAGLALVAHGFDQYSYPRFMSETGSDNVASTNVMKRVGMTVYKIAYTAECWSNDKGVYYPGWVGVIERSEWLSTHGANSSS